MPQGSYSFIYFCCIWSIMMWTRWLYMVNTVFYFPYIAVIYFCFLSIGLCGLVHIYIHLVLYCAVLIWLVVSNPLWPHGLYVACQAPLSMGIFQARILEWLAMPTSRASSQPRDQTQGSNPGLTHCRWILHHLSHQGSPYIHFIVRQFHLFYIK